MLFFSITKNFIKSPWVKAFKTFIIIYQQNTMVFCLLLHSWQGFIKTLFQIVPAMPWRRKPAEIFSVTWREINTCMKVNNLISHRLLFRLQIFFIYLFGCLNTFDKMNYYKFSWYLMKQHIKCFQWKTWKPY